MRAPCPAKHPMTGRGCMESEGHGGMHRTRGAGFWEWWRSDVDIDQTTPSGGRIRIRAAEITISREES